MRPLVLVVVLLLAAGCRSTDPSPAPEVPLGATALVLSDDELPRTLYASAWGAFAVAEWEVVESDPEAFRLRVRPSEEAAALDLVVAPEMEYGRAVAAQAVATSGDPAVLEAAAAVLATIPGHLTIR